MPYRTVPIEAVVVAVPARDEEAAIVPCLAAIEAAAAVWGGTVHVVVGADSCRDDTAARARSAAAGSRAASVLVLEGDWGGVGATRGAAAAAGLARCAGHEPEGVWLANTDADGTVPPCWVAAQVAQAEQGADVVVGAVAIDSASTSPDLVAAFGALYEADRAAHVHGANLGIRASAYRAVGGWSSHVLGEDHDLVRRATAGGWTVVGARGAPVTTSARTAGRAAGGFAAVIDRLRRHLDGGGGAGGLAAITATAPVIR